MNIGLQNHKFYDNDIETVSGNSSAVEFQIKEGCEAIIMNVCDVMALVRHFGLTVIDRKERQ